MLTEGTPINIIGRLQENTGRYVPRSLKRKVYLHVGVVRDSDSYPNIIAVSGMEKSYLTEIVTSYGIVGNFYLEKDSKTGNWIESHKKFKPSGFIILRNKNLRLCFSKLREMRSGKTLHWLKFKNRCLLWIESRGGIDSLINFVDPERTHGDKRIITKFMKRGNCEVIGGSISDLSKRTVLVVADPGRRKSSTTTHVAWHTKLADHTSWIVRMNWNDHTKELQKINEPTLNFDSLVEFLRNAAFPKSKYSDFGRILLKQTPQISGSVTVLIDEFDLISPFHMNKAAAVLSELMKNKVERVWVTSRPVEK